MDFGTRLKQLRKEKNMTQADLANKLGIPYQSISQWERNLRTPKASTLQKLADALGVDVLAFGPRIMLSEGVYVPYDSLGWVKYLHDDELEDTQNNEHLNRISQYFLRLNDEGQRVAADRVQELTYVLKYQFKISDK